MSIKNNQLELPFTSADKAKLDAVQTGAQVNPAYASQAVAEAGVDNAQIMTALRVKQAIDVFASSAGESNTASNLGAGDGEVFSSKNAVDLRFRSLVAGTNVTISQDANEITINATGGGGGDVDSVNGLTGVVVLDADDIDDSATANKFTTASDISKLAGIASGAQVNRALASQAEAEAGSENTKGMTPLRVAQAIAALAGSSGQSNTASNLTGDEGIFFQKSGVDLEFKSLTAGTNITLDSTDDTITISATASGGSDQPYRVVLPAAATIADRLGTAVKPTGWTLDTADNDAETQFGSDAETLVITWDAELGNKIAVVRVFEDNTATSVVGGIKALDIEFGSIVKTNSSQTKVAILFASASFSTSRDLYISVTLV